MIFTERSVKKTPQKNKSCRTPSYGVMTSGVQGTVRTFICTTLLQVLKKKKKGEVASCPFDFDASYEVSSILDNSSLVDILF